MRFRPSKLFRDAFASCLWSAPVFGILWYVRLTHGRDAMYDVFAVITAWGILAALIFAFRGEGEPSKTRPLEGPGEGLSVQCASHYKGLRCRDFVGHSGQHRAPYGHKPPWQWPDEYADGFQVQSEEGGGDE